MRRTTRAISGRAENHRREDRAGAARGAILRAMASEPEFLICLNCETPTYSFEWEEGKITAALCTACGNDDPTEFMTETELDEQRT